MFYSYLARYIEECKLSVFIIIIIKIIIFYVATLYSIIYSHFFYVFLNLNF